jgi:hypothetical protein
MVTSPNVLSEVLLNYIAAVKKNLFLESNKCPSSRGFLIQCNLDSKNEYHLVTWDNLCKVLGIRFIKVTLFSTHPPNNYLQSI